MNKFMDALNKGFAPRAQKIANNQWILTIKNSILQVLPFIFVGSLITLLDIPANFLNGGQICRRLVALLLDLHQFLLLFFSRLM